MPLALSIRKGIRDSEASAKEALEQIQKATGKEFSVDVNWEENVGKLHSSYNKDNIGNLYNKECLTNVAYCIQEAVKDELVKESFNEATSNNKIQFRINEKAKNYFNIVFENGNLIIEHKPEIYNVGDLSYINLAPLLPAAGGIPITVRQNLNEKKADADNYLASIASTTGTGDWTYEANWDAIVPKLDANTANRIGTIYFSEILYGIDYLLKQKLANELTKEAFNEVTSQRKIIFELNDKIDKYWKLSFRDGALLVEHKKDIYNTGDVAYYDLEPIIPVPGLITLVSKLNLNETKSNLETALADIKTASGVDWTFDESTIEPFYEKLTADERKRVGNIIYKEVIPNLAYNLQNALKDEMVKEAVLETASNHTIKLAVDQKQSPYWDIKFADGNVVLSAKTPIYNTGDISYINIEKLL